MWAADNSLLYEQETEVRQKDDRKVFDAVDQVIARASLIFTPIFHSSTLCVFRVRLCLLLCRFFFLRLCKLNLVHIGFVSAGSTQCVCLQDGNGFLTYQDIEKLSRDMGEKLDFKQLNTILDTATDQGTKRRITFERFEEVGM